MFLKHLVIINYKSCQYFDIKLDENFPNVFIGINDCGKSSILKAIGLLMEEKPAFNFEKDDKKKNDISFSQVEEAKLEENLSKIGLPMPPGYTSAYEGNNGIRKAIFMGHFQLEEADLEELEQNSSTSNHLLWVLDNVGDNSIWLARIFDEESARFSDLMLTLDRKEDPLELFNQKMNRLQKIREEFGVTDAEIENENRRGRYKNIELIRAVYNNKVDLENVWAPYKRKTDQWLFPTYHYLDWNFSIDQLEEYTKELLELKIQDQVNEAKRLASEQADEAQSYVNDELKKISAEITEDLPHIESLTANLHFDVKLRLTDYLVKKKYAELPVQIDNQGEGLKRQIWFGILRWKAKEEPSIKKNTKKFIWCFDEPETHLYPKAQREFFDLIKRVSTQNIQVLLSTHSSIFVDKAALRSINKVELDENGFTSHSKCGHVDDIYTSLKLRNSDFLFHDKFLVIEGDTEEHLIPELYKLYKGRTLAEDNIQLVNLKGKDKIGQNKNILEGILKDFRKVEDRVVYLFDNDASFQLSQKQKDETPNLFFVGRQDLEDSFCSSVWKTVVEERHGERIEIRIEEIDGIKDSIPKDHEEKNSGQKFYKKLERLIRSKLKEAYPDEEFHYELLPVKGVESAGLIQRHIKDPAQLDQNLINAFKALG